MNKEQTPKGTDTQGTDTQNTRLKASEYDVLQKQPTG